MEKPSDWLQGGENSEKDKYSGTPRKIDYRGASGRLIEIVRVNRKAKAVVPGG